ncbi:MAG: chemotaxis protein CheW [Nitrospira sp.]|nr:chemotaxis protein CheW [Nitrospira sp.]
MGLRGHFKSTTTDVHTVSLLVVRYGASYCALPSDGVRGVLTKDQAGQGETVNWVGITYQRVDLAAQLSTKLDAASPDLRIVLFSNGHSHGAIHVDEVVGLLDADQRECKPLPPHFRCEERTWVTGMIQYRSDLAIVLDPEWVLGELEAEASPTFRAMVGRSFVS